jgi:hypothetical protein
MTVCDFKLVEETVVVCSESYVFNHDRYHVQDLPTEWVVWLLSKLGTNSLVRYFVTVSNDR